MQMQKLMSTFRGVPLRRKPLTARRKNRTQTGERHLLIINLITTFHRVLLNCRNIDRILWKKLGLLRRNIARINIKEVILRTSSTAIFLKLRALVNIQFYLVAQIPGEIARWGQMPYLTRKCRSRKNNLTRLRTLYFRSFSTENRTKRKNTRKILWRVGVSEIDQTSNLLYIVQSSASRFKYIISSRFRVFHLSEKT